jgi:hypothetical protein
MKNILLSAFFVFTLSSAYSQKFEAPQDTAVYLNGDKVRVGADFAMQFQSLSHSADTELISLGKGLNLPTANLNLNAHLAPGISLNLVTYLSARHHNEAWVKGGYIIIDELPFIKAPAIDKAMELLTLKVGDMELDFGDAHYRRSDNGRVVTNPFVGNYIMESFTTAPAAELMFRKSDIILMGAVTSGILKQDLVSFSARDSMYTSYNTLSELGFYWKGGIDRQFNDDFRLRLTLSGYHNPKNHSGSLYNGDRAGSRYYLVMKPVTYQATDVDIKSGHTSGNFGPGSLKKTNAYMFNLFTKYRGIELFGTLETVKGVTVANIDTKFVQYAIEGLYYFGRNENFFAGARYNLVTDKENDVSVTRLNVGAGWFLIPSVVLKAEYVNQTYKDSPIYGDGAGFNGFMVETAISF